MTPAPTPPPARLDSRVDVLEGKVRQLEARYAQVVDRVDIYGPPPKRWNWPELTEGQRQTAALVVALVLLFTLRAVYAGEKTKGVPC